MHVLFASLDAHGHTYPLLPLAIAARDLGHRVTFVCGERFHGLLTGLGFEAATAGIRIEEAFHIASGVPRHEYDRHGAPPEEVADIVATIFGTVLPRRTAADLAPILRRTRPDLVVAESAAHGAALAAVAEGVPVVLHAVMRGARDDRLTHRLRAVATEVGAGDALPLPEHGMPFLDIYPTSIQEPTFRSLPNRIPLRPVPFTEPGELPPWVGREPVMYLTLGTHFGDAAILRAAIQGLSRLPGRLLVATGPSVDGAALGAVPDGVHVVPWVPQADLLPHVRLLVHHGGCGTLLAGLACGVPQVVIPQGVDQFVNADVVAGTGAGVHLPRGAVTAEAVAEAAMAVLGDGSMGAQAGELAEEIAGMPGPGEVAGRLSALAG